MEQDQNQDDYLLANYGVSCSLMIYSAPDCSNVALMLVELVFQKCYIIVEIYEAHYII